MNCSTRSGPRTVAQHCYIMWRCEHPSGPIDSCLLQSLEAQSPEAEVVSHVVRKHDETIG